MWVGDKDLGVIHKDYEVVDGSLEVARETGTAKKKDRPKKARRRRKKSTRKAAA